MFQAGGNNNKLFNFNYFNYVHSFKRYIGKQITKEKKTRQEDYFCIAMVLFTFTEEATNKLIKLVSSAYKTGEMPED